jgi:hypothetical protein
MTTTRSALTRTLHEGLTDEEWRVVRTARATVMSWGKGVSAKKVVEALQSQISGPIQVWRAGARLVLPPVEQAGTLILQEPGAMAHEDQRHLRGWLQVSSGHTRVISTARQPMLPLLEAGTFSDTLTIDSTFSAFRSVPHRRGVRARVREESHGEHANPSGATAIRWDVAQERLVLGRVGRLEIQFRFNCERAGDDALGNLRRSAPDGLNQRNLKDVIPDCVRAGV